MSAGASLSDTVARTLNSKPYRAIMLWQRILAQVRLEDGLISGVVTQADWQAVGYDEPDDGGLVAYLIATEEARAAVVYKERADGGIEISLRSKPGCDVAAVAVALGGGGHRQASGALIPGPLADAQARAVPLLRAALANTITANQSAP
jgi:phosphoesterase RecJ-like protein